MKSTWNSSLRYEIEQLRKKKKAFHSRNKRRDPTFYKEATLEWKWDKRKTQ